MVDDPKDRVPKEAQENDPNKTEIILTGQLDELKLGIPLALAIVQLQQRQAEYFEEVLAAIDKHPQPVDVHGHPKVTLIFLENYYQFYKRLAKSPKTTRGRAQIAFRLMDKTSKSMTKTDIEKLAKTIKAKFAKPPFTWIKGKEMYYYKDKKIGKRLDCFAQNQEQARRLFEQVLDLVKESPKPEKITKGVSLAPAIAFDDTPGNEIILGEPVRQEQQRPVVEVEFASAYIMIPGLRKPIYLVDRFARHKAIVDNS